MRYNSKIIISVLFFSAIPLLMLSSCTEQMEMLFSTPIRLTATSESIVTRTAQSAGTNIQNGSFDSGTTINGYFKIHNGAALGNTPTILTTSAVSNNKQTLTPDVQVYYPNSDGTTVDISAFYPPAKVTNTSTEFTVENDQTTDANYKLSDLMYAEVINQTRTDNDVNLSFSHKMAKVVVNATSEEGVYITKIRLLNVKRNISLNAGTGELGSLGATADAITIATDAEGTTSLSGAALLPPQPIAADFIEVSVKYTYGSSATLKEGTTKFSLYGKTFSGGEQYTANVTVTRQSIGYTTTITDWENDEGSVAVIPGSNSLLFIGNVDEQTYTGSVIRPKPEITYTENSIAHEVTEGTDYTLQYFNNTNIGTATIIISGVSTSNYEPMRKLMALKSFEIIPKDGALRYQETDKTVDYQYNLTIDNPLVAMKEDGTIDADDTVERDGAFTYSSSNESVATVSSTGLVTVKGQGDCTITANMDNSGNFNACTATFSLHVNKRNASNMTITLYPTTFEYNGQARIPSIVVTDGGRTLKLGEDYTCDTSTDITNNINRGTATVTVHGAGNYTSTGNETFTITQATPVITMTTGDVTLAKGFTVTRAATTTLGNVVLTSSTSAATVTQEGVVTANSAGTAVITATVTADNADESKANYKTVTKYYTVTVEEPDETFSYPTEGSFEPSVKEWTCPVDGTYKLEVWGAQGAEAGSFFGGKGAYIAGNLYITKGITLYVYVGVQGSGSTGGWNGGGSTSSTSGTYAGGGGATDFSLDKNNHLYSRILVAGGGGGALYYPTKSTYGGGGAGGVINGEPGSAGSNPGGGGTLTGGGTAGGSNAEPGSFGQGGGYNGSTSVGMGGGGWYGGGSGGDAASDTRQGSGGGGSSYIWNEENAGYYPSGKSTLLTEDFYIDPVGATEGARSGNGQARITYVSQERE
ncbi:MAG: fimbrillin family protein [Prevotella sp.]|nr:fimbrillin family protein [Prevotella sp.]